ARAAHVEQLIVPALSRGATVVCDRYIDSSVAYQGTGRGLGTEEVLELNRWATGGLRPDLTIVLDVDPQAGRQRRTAGEAAEDRLESEPDDFHARIRQAFLDRAGHDDGAYLVLDGSRGVKDLAADIAAAVDALARLAVHRSPGVGTLPRGPLLRGRAAVRCGRSGRPRLRSVPPLPHGHG